MGCDIHQYAEVRMNGVWIAEQAPNFVIEKDDDDSEGYVTMPDSGNRDRNYFLFGLLSEGVRYDCPFAFAPKGEPEDASTQVKQLIEQWEGDGHSHNYLTFQELGEKQAELLLLHTDKAQEYLQTLQKWVSSFGPTNGDPKDRRVVFWFDN